MTSPTITEAPDGLLVKGEYRGGFQQKDREKDGTTYKGRYVVSVLAGRRVIDIEYADEPTARLAIETVFGDMPEVGSAIWLPIGQRAAKGYIFNFGRTGGGHE